MAEEITNSDDIIDFSEAPVWSRARAVYRKTGRKA